MINIIEMKKLIEDNLTIKKEEKNKFGEVFSQLTFINEMLDTLPSYVWSNPNLKWLDPANGIGNFPIIVYERLMKGLEKSFSNRTECSNHIITKMLFMVEINPNNVKISKRIFGDNANIFCGDFLTMDIKDKFDIIIGNPPFQKTFENQNKRAGGTSLWSKFINTAFPMINKDGFLLFITPCSWMSGGSNIQSGNILNGIFKKNTLLYLDIENCAKYFKGVKSTFSYYLIKKSFENTAFPCVVLYKKKLYKSIINQELFRSLNVIPKLFTQETINIIKKVENKNKNKFNFQRRRDLDTSQIKFQRIYDLDTRLIKRYDAQGIYIVKHKVVEIKRTNYFQESCMNKHKVIISMPGYIKAEYDFESGCSDATLFQIVKDKEEAEYIISLLNNNLYKFIINNYRELTGLNNHKNINNLSYPPRKVKDIYGYYKITKEEQQLIEEVVKN